MPEYLTKKLIPAKFRRPNADHILQNQGHSRNWYLSKLSNTVNILLNTVEKKDIHHPRLEARQAFT